MKSSMESVFHRGGLEITHYDHVFNLVQQGDQGDCL